jgi:hypothetical protein
MSIAMRIVLLAVGALMIVFGVHLSITDGVMGLWSSGPMSGFTPSGPSAARRRGACRGHTNRFNPR